MRAILLTATTLTVALSFGVAQGYVTPKMGGGQVMAPMLHVDVGFDGANLSLHLDPNAIISPPVLRPLVPPAQFDPTAAWAVLSNKSYNFQYAWNYAGSYTFPTGTWGWIEETSALAELDVYQRPPATPSYAPIFGTSGSPLYWKWPGSMTHNAYAVYDVCQASYSATYRAYIGDVGTGVEVKDAQGNPVYGSATITLTWRAQGDCNGDGLINSADIDSLYQHLGNIAYDLNGSGATDLADVDYLVQTLKNCQYGDANLDHVVDVRDLGALGAHYGQSGCGWAQADFSGDGTVDVIDLGLLGARYGWTAPPHSAPAALPEPATMALLALGGLAMACRRRT